MPTLILTRPAPKLREPCVRCLDEVPGYRVARVMEALERRKRQQRLMEAAVSRRKKIRVGGRI